MHGNNRYILLVSGDLSTRQIVAGMLRKELDAVVVETDSPDEARDILEEQEICLVVTDLYLPGKEGLDLYHHVHKESPVTAVVIMLPQGNREAIVEVLKVGAAFYLNLPIDLDETVIICARALEHHELLVHKRKAGRKIRKKDGFHGILGASAKMKKLFNMLAKVADDDISTVLIQGESGTGKELVARAIHAHSPRRNKNFVPVNCAAIPEDLLESELFGYVKGAFTGATQSKMGRIQYADGGTLFLDEIGDMKPLLQAKLLRVLQEREFEPVGGVKPVSVNVRVVAATHRDLEKLVAEGNFREDLYYRLSVVPLHIPPLRDRRDDIPMLIERFVAAFNRNKPEPFKGFGEEAMTALVNYPWPGNVRELENLVQRMSILHGGDVTTLDDLPVKYSEKEGQGDESEMDLLMEVPINGADLDFNSLVSQFEDRLIFQALTRTGGNKKEAAKLLNLKRTTLIEKIKKKQLQGAF